MKEKSLAPIHRFNIAIPEELWERVQLAAQQNRRSVTQQILVALDWTTRTFRKEEDDESTSSF